MTYELIIDFYIDPIGMPERRISHYNSQYELDKAFTNILLNKREDMVILNFWKNVYH